MEKQNNQSESDTCRDNDTLTSISTFSFSFLKVVSTGFFENKTKHR